MFVQLLVFLISLFLISYLMTSWSTALTAALKPRRQRGGWGGVCPAARLYCADSGSKLRHMSKMAATPEKEIILASLLHSGRKWRRIGHLYIKVSCSVFTSRNHGDDGDGRVITLYQHISSCTLSYVTVTLVIIIILYYSLDWRCEPSTSVCSMFDSHLSGFTCFCFYYKNNSLHTWLSPHRSYESQSASWWHHQVNRKQRSSCWFRPHEDAVVPTDSFFRGTNQRLENILLT